MPASTPSSLSRAAALGALTSAPAGLAITLGYYLQHSGSGAFEQGWSWGLWSLAIILSTPIIGAYWAAGASAGVEWSARRRGLLGNLALGGFVGGSAGGLLPMVICVGVFGSLHVPYVGTALVGFSLLLSFLAFAIVHPLAERPEPSPQPTGLVRGLAALLVVVPLGIAVMALLAIVFPWDTIVVIRDELMQRSDDPGVLVAVGAILSAPLLGGSLGGLLGASTGLARILAGVLGPRD